MQRYYFMVRFLPQEANLALLMGRCISVMHGYICKHEIKGLGVTFPAWSDASIGNIIAFVKDQSLWQGIAFGLAFSFSIEVIQHRVKERS